MSKNYLGDPPVMTLQLFTHSLHTRPIARACIRCCVLDRLCMGGDVMNARDKIAEITDRAIDQVYNPTRDATNQEYASAVSDAILAALPDILRADPSILRGMVKPLDQETHMKPNSVAGTYRVSQTRTQDFGWITRVYLNDTQIGHTIYRHDNAEGWKVANAHHVATTLQPLGVTVEGVA